MAVSSAVAVRLRGGAALLALLCALSAADAAFTCPAGSGTTSISCYEGGTFVGTPPLALLTDGLCTCLCGASADYDYQTSAGSTTQFLSNATACTAAACTSKFSKFCAVANSPVAIHLTAALAAAAQEPASKVSGANTICGSLTTTCTGGASNPCPSFLSSGTVTQYFAITPNATNTVTQVCSDMLKEFAASGVTVTALCTSTNCNAPGAKSAAAAAAPAKALLATAAVVALAAAAL